MTRTLRMLLPTLGLLIAWRSWRGTRSEMAVAPAASSGSPAPAA